MGMLASFPFTNDAVTAIGAFTPVGSAGKSSVFEKIE
jgi:hypothetical protein